MDTTKKAAMDVSSAEKKDNILYYKVPVFEETDTCFCCGENLVDKYGSYYFFWDDKYGTFETAFHYCPKCDIAYKTSQELADERGIIENRIGSKVRIEIINVDEQSRISKMKREASPSRASGFDGVLIGTLPADRIEPLLRTAPSLMEWFIAVRSLVDSKRGASLQVWINNNQYTNALSVQEVQSLKQFREECINGKNHEEYVPKRITTKKRLFKSIVILKGPEQIDYIEKQKFNASGMVVSALYDDESTEIIKDYQINAPQELSIEDKYVEIVYRGQKINQRINVRRKTLQSIVINKPPQKTEYIEGQFFIPEGMSVSAVFDNGVTEFISEYSIDNLGKPLSLGDNMMIIRAQSQMVAQQILVRKKKLLKIEITTAPLRMEYCKGQEFDPRGMVVTATYDNDSTEIIDDYQYDASGMITPGECNVVISYLGKKAIQSITIIRKLVDLSRFIPFIGYRGL